MRNVEITADAINIIEDACRKYKSRLGDKYCPIVVWQVNDSAVNNFDPHVTLAFEKLDKIDKERSLYFSGDKICIYQYLPDEALAGLTSPCIIGDNGKICLIDAAAN
jgi:hypothetical protein